MRLLALLLAPAVAACASSPSPRPAAPAPAASASKPTASAPASGTRPAPRAGGIDLAGMDRAVAPGDDFFAFANGAWIATAEIPPERAYAGPILQVVEVVAGRTRAILDDAAAAQAPEGSELRQIGDTWSSFMDEAAIEARGLEPLRPALRGAAAIGDRKALAAALGSAVRADVDPLNDTNLYTPNVLGLWVEQDLDVPGRNAAYLLQGGLGMPDRGYYLDEGGDFASLRRAYRDYLATLLRLRGVAADEAAARAGRVLELEIRIARTHATRTDSADVRKANNPWRRGDFAARAPGMDWGAFLDAAGLGRQEAFIVWHPGAVAGLAKLVAQEPLPTWREYLEVRALDGAAPFLPRAFVEAHFAFHGTALQGTPRMLPRWKRGVAVVDDALGDAVGKIYAARHFPESDRRELQEMVDRIVAAFDRRIQALSWMTPATKAKARAKLAGLRVGIAYPDTWRSYAGLVVVRGDALGNRERAGLFARGQAIARLSRKPDRGEWAMLPQTVNAVNLPLRNALNFPAGFLEPPFYDRTASAAVKYGSIGSVIGHEVSHAFDDQGALFDADGRLASWWTAEDQRHFEAAAERLVAQYDAYHPFPDLAVNGRLTLSENIADLAGLAAAHDGWRDSLGGAAAPVLDGLDGEAQFFLAFAQAWRVKERDQALREAVLTDGHAPARFRTFTVRNLDAWYEAFGVVRGQALWLDPADRVRIW